MDFKQKNLTSAMKKISNNIEAGRKNIEGDTDLVQNLTAVKASFGQIENVIKNQVPALDNMKSFSNKVSSQSSKNLQVKRFFHGYLQRVKAEFKQYLEVVKQNFVVSLKQKTHENWSKIDKQLDRSFEGIKDQCETSQKIYAAINRLNAAKDHFLVQFFKLMLYKKNILWRDLNAPYDDYIHGEIKSSINLIKNNEEKYGYIPHTLQFNLLKFQVEQLDSSVPDLLRIIMVDYRQMIDGLKNYSKLSDQPQVIEDISKNQHIVKGLREKIQVLTIKYEEVLQKYRDLQIKKSKPGSGPNEEKSLTEKLEEKENLLLKKEQQIIDLKKMSLKMDELMMSEKKKNKDLQDELSQWHKYQLPKIKQMESNQRSILDEFTKVKRDLETYSNIVQTQRQQKLKTLEQLNIEKKRVYEMANILGRQRRRIKQLKLQISRQEKIVMELVDKLPDK